MVRIVVLGGGFGGVYVATSLRSLLAEKRNSLTLISENDYFVFTPLLHEIAVGKLDPDAITIGLNDLINNQNYDFVEGKATEISIRDNFVKCGNKKISFDYLVIAYGVKALSDKTTLKTIEDALTIWDKLSKLPNNAQIGVIGGGATGIELASELACKFNVTIFQRAKTILPSAIPRFRDLAYKILRARGIKVLTNVNVVEKSNSIVMNSKEKIKMDYTIWCIGSAQQKLAVDMEVYNDKGAIVVNKHLLVNGTRNVFALGDCAATGAPLLAQTAEQQSKIVKANVINSIRNKPLVDFEFDSKGFIVSLGRYNAVAQIGSFVFSGFFAWWLKRTIYLFKIVGLLPKFRLMKEYTIKLFR